MGRDWRLVASATASPATGGWDASATCTATSRPRCWPAAARRAGPRRTPPTPCILPFIEELFPDALYVHLLRDGHDVVASFRDRWGYRSAARAARGEWARYVEAARDLGGAWAAAASWSCATRGSWPTRRRSAAASSPSWARPGTRACSPSIRAEHDRHGALPPVHRAAPRGGRRERRDLPLAGRVPAAPARPGAAHAAAAQLGALLRELGYSGH